LLLLVGDAGPYRREVESLRYGGPLGARSAREKRDEPQKRRYHGSDEEPFDDEAEPDEQSYEQGKQD
jgi:hypothetical protein